MADKSVLFVGLAVDQIQSISVPDDVEAKNVDNVAEAADIISLTSPSVIVSNDKIGDLDSLEFFTRVLEARPDIETPVFFLASPTSGVDPFVYEHRRSGFEARYLDADGALHTHFVTEESREKDFTVRSLRRDSVLEEVRRYLSGDVGSTQELTQEEFEARVWELGFNQEVAVDGANYHVQTEVIDIKPLTVATTVFCSGRALHSCEQRIKTKEQTLGRLRTEVESAHVGVVSQVHAGELLG